MKESRKLRTQIWKFTQMTSDQANFRIFPRRSFFSGPEYFQVFMQMLDLFRLCPPPPPYIMRPPVTEHVLLLSKSLCKIMARASGGCK